MKKITCVELKCLKCDKDFFVRWYRRNKAKYCSQECYRASNSFNGFEKEHTRWNHPNVIKSRFKKRSGSWMSEGYKFIYMPKHPNARSDGGISEHRLVMEKYLGRYLKSEEIVHHKNRDRSDNRIKNLELIDNRKEHIELHIKENVNA